MHPTIDTSPTRRTAVHGRILVLLLATSTAFGPAGLVRASDDAGGSPRARAGAAASAVDVQSRPLATIPPGTAIGNEPPKGWSHLILQSRPRLGVGDVDSVPKFATQYTSIFLFTVLANVRQSASNGATPSYYLEKV